MDTNIDRPVLFFDGVCNLCNHAVQFVIKHDHGERFLFASLQSAYAKSKMPEIQQALGKVPDSMVLFYKGKYYVKSDAALHTARLLGGWSSLLAAGLVVPRFIRNTIYDGVARNRYRWFGRRDECMIPTPALKGRFLD